MEAFPQADKADELLHAVAAEVENIMRKHGLRIGELVEIWDRPWGRPPLSTVVMMFAG